MRVILDEQESQSFMSVITSLIIDQVELSDEAANAIRDWRLHLEEGSEDLGEFAEQINVTLGNKLDDETRKVIRRRDYYRS